MTQKTPTKADVLELLDRLIAAERGLDPVAFREMDGAILEELKGLMQQAPDKMIETLFRLRSALKMEDADLLKLLDEMPVD